VFFGCGAELPALAPGARCPSGRSAGSGAPGTAPKTGAGRGRCGGRRRSPRGGDTPGTSEIRRECWSRGRIVSALLSAAQGGCRPSMEPPNPVAATLGRPGAAGNGLPPFRHRSSPWATALHEGGFIVLRRRAIRSTSPAPPVAPPGSTRGSRHHLRSDPSVASRLHRCFCLKAMTVRISNGLLPLAVHGAGSQDCGGSCFIKSVVALPRRTAAASSS